MNVWVWVREICICVGVSVSVDLCVWFTLTFASQNSPSLPPSLPPSSSSFDLSTFTVFDEKVSHFHLDKPGHLLTFSFPDRNLLRPRCMHLLQPYYLLLLQCKNAPIPLLGRCHVIPCPIPNGPHFIHPTIHCHVSSSDERDVIQRSGVRQEGAKGV